MILSQILKTIQPENLEVFMAIHYCYCGLFFFLFPRAWPKTTEVTLWLDPRGCRSVFPLDAHVAPAVVAGVCPVPVPSQFQFPVSTLHNKLRHLPPSLSNFWQENHNASYSPWLLHQQYIWEMGSTYIECIYTRMTHHHPWGQLLSSCWGCTCACWERERITVSPFLLGGLRRLSPSHKRLLQTDVWEAQPQL